MLIFQMAYTEVLRVHGTCLNNFSATKGDGGDECQMVPTVELWKDTQDHYTSPYFFRV